MGIATENHADVIGHSKFVLGWYVTATPVVCGLQVYWLGVFDGQQIPTRFVSADSVFAHVANCLNANRHPCKNMPKDS